MTSAERVETCLDPSQHFSGQSVKGEENSSLSDDRYTLLPICGWGEVESRSLIHFVLVQGDVVCLCHVHTPNPSQSDTCHWDIKGQVAHGNATHDAWGAPMG